MLVIEPRTFLLVNKCPTTELHSQPVAFLRPPEPHPGSGQCCVPTEFRAPSPTGSTWGLQALEPLGLAAVFPWWCPGKICGDIMGEPLTMQQVIQGSPSVLLCPVVPLNVLETCLPQPTAQPRGKVGSLTAHPGRNVRLVTGQARNARLQADRREY